MRLKLIIKNGDDEILLIFYAFSVMIQFKEGKMMPKVIIEKDDLLPDRAVPSQSPAALPSGSTPAVAGLL